MELKVASEPTDQTIADLRVKAEECLAVCDRSELPQLRKTFPILKKKKNTVWNRARPTGSRIITRLPAEYSRAWVFFLPDKRGRSVFLLIETFCQWKAPIL